MAMFQIDGFQETDVEEKGDCCELLEGEPGTGDYTCRWEVKTIELPDFHPDRPTII